MLLIATSIAVALGSKTLLAQGQSNASDFIYELKDVSVRPKPISTPNPEYCEKARRKKIAGTVLLEMTVAADGSVRDVKVTQSLFPCLDVEAVAAVRTWKFEPARKEGKPVAVHLNSEVGFYMY